MRPGPDLLQQLSTVLLLAVGLSLLLPLFGGPLPSLWAVAGVLGLRLALQLWQVFRSGGQQHWASLLLSAALLVLLLLQARATA